MLTTMVSFRRQSVERNSWKVSGRSLRDGKGVDTEDRTFWAKWAASSGMVESPESPESPSAGPRGAGGERVSPCRPLALHPKHQRRHGLRSLSPRRDRGAFELPREPWRPGGIQSLVHRDSELVAVGDDDRGPEVAEAGHRRGNGRTAGGQALVRLDGIEALSERIDQVGNDHDIRMLHECRDLVVGEGPEQTDVGHPVQACGHFGGKMVGPEQDDLEVRSRACQFADQRDVESLDMEGADVEGNGPPGQGRRSGPGSAEHLHIDPVRNELDVAAAPPRAL